MTDPCPACRGRGVDPDIGGLCDSCHGSGRWPRGLPAMLQRPRCERLRCLCGFQVEVCPAETDGACPSWGFDWGDG